MAASSSWCLLATSLTRWPSVSPSRLQQRLPGAVADLGASSPIRRPHGVICMAPQEERKTRRSPLDFPIWERPKPPRRPDIFPQFSPMKTPLPHPLPEDPPQEDEEEEEEEQQQEEEEEKPDEEESEKPEQSRMQHGWSAFTKAKDSLETSFRKYSRNLHFGPNNILIKFVPAIYSLVTNADMNTIFFPTRD